MRVTMEKIVVFSDTLPSLPSTQVTHQMIRRYAAQAIHERCVEVTSTNESLSSMRETTPSLVEVLTFLNCL